MSLHKPSGLHLYPKYGGDNPSLARAPLGESSPPNWKTELSPVSRIEFEIASLRQRIFDIERIRGEGSIDGKPINAAVRRNWHRGTRQKIKMVLELVEKYGGDREGFLEELRYMEQRSLGGEVLTGSLQH